MSETTREASMQGAADLLEALGFGTDTSGLVIWCKEVNGPEHPAKRFEEIGRASCRERV